MKREGTLGGVCELNSDNSMTILSFPQLEQQKQLASKVVGPQALSGSGTGGAGGGTMVWDQLLSNSALQGQATPVDLRTQVQPFQDLQPDEIQDQLQRLHIQHPDAAVLVVSPSLPPEYKSPSPAFSVGQGQQVSPGFSVGQQAPPTFSAGGQKQQQVATVDSGGNAQHHQMQHSNSNDSNSSIASSRKSSTGSVLIAQLLSPSPPAIPIPSPQTEGMASSGFSPPSNGSLSRKTSLQNPSTIQKHVRPHR